MRAQRLRSTAVCGAAVLAGLMPACSQEPASTAVSVDGGGQGVVLLGDHVVAGEGGGTVTIEHAGDPAPPDDEAPVTHAFIGGAGSQLPGLFTRAAGGRIPNPAVWGHCAGGSVTDAADGCPVPPLEAPKRWDGAAYWSTGALLPGESRDVPLADDLPDGDLPLVCAFHPELRVLVRVDGEVATPPPPLPVNQAVKAAAATQGRPGTVTAGVTLDGAFVGRFFPPQITIGRGDAVTWVARGRAPVDVVFNGGDLDLTHTGPGDAQPAGDPTAWAGRGELRSGFLSGDPGAGATAARWRVRFTRPGRYEYASRFGSLWRGVVVVEDR